MLTALPFARMQARVKAYNSACCVEVARGKGAASMISEGVTIA